MTNSVRRLLSIIPAAFVVLVTGYHIERTEVEARRDAQRQIERHARVISDAMWELDREGRRDYLGLAIRRGNYERLVVTTSDGEPFFSGTGTPLETATDRFLASMGLIPLEHLRANVTHASETIGSIEGSVRIKTIYTDLNAILIGLLLLIAYRLYLGLVAANRDLDGKVHQRTATLEASEARFRSFYDLPLIGFIEVVPGKPGIFANERLSEMLGYSREEFLNLTWEEITHPDDLDACLREYQRLLAGEIPAYSLEKRYLRKDGSFLWAAIAVSCVRNPDGTVKRACGYLQDVSERRAAEQALRISEDRYRTVFQTSLDVIVLSHLEDERIVDVNQAFVQVTGYERHEVIGKSASDLGLWKDSEDRDRIVAILVEKGNLRDAQASFRRKDGEHIWGLVSAAIVDIDGEPHSLAVIRDVTAAKEAEAEIKNLAFYDPLTGLANRRLLIENLRRALAFVDRTQRYAALLIADIDRFRDLNDAYGHADGDLFLEEVAHRITECVREMDTVSRVANDEFAVLYEDLGLTTEDAASQAKSLGERILRLFQDPFAVGGHEVVATVSIGITVFGRESENAAEVFREAEIALHKAKAQGHGPLHFFAPDLQKSATTRSLLEKDLRQALRCGEFELYFQPQVEGGSIVGAEALLRWEHPSRGLLMPDEFIPAAEHAGLISGLGEWVLEAACSQVVSWAKQPELAGIKLAVNISALEFLKHNFVSIVADVLERTGVNAANLKLELTESAMAEDVDDVVAKMTALKSRGVTLSLDDFGTGYSSLAYLKRLPLDELKIDRVFVRDLLNEASSVAIAQTILSLGKALRLPVIAEGVENEAQLELLDKLGCHCFQGFFYSRPLPVEQFEAFVARFTSSEE